MDRQDCYTVEQLFKRGWTGELIGQLLKSPDRFSEWVSKNKITHFTELYEVSRVHEQELSVAFQQCVTGRAKKRKDKATQEDIAQTLAILRKKLKHTHVKRLPVNVLLRNAWLDYEYHAAQKNKTVVPTQMPLSVIEERLPQPSLYPDVSISREARQETQVGFCRRMCFNYLRHSLSSYEDFIEWCRSRPGFDVTYRYLRTWSFRQIVKAYPWLRTTAERLVNRYHKDVCLSVRSPKKRTGGRVKVPVR